MLRRCAVIVAVMLVPAWASAEDTPVLETQKDKVSYALGLDLGNQLRKATVEVDPALFGRGLKDGISGGPTLLTEQQIRDAISGLQAELKKKEENRRKGSDESDIEASLLAAYNKRAADAFLAANKTKAGVVTLANGLQYKVLTAGDGKKPSESDMVVCQYRGALTDGTEFDSSFQRGQAATFAVKDVMPGLREAVKIMGVGSKYQLFIPPELAYGERGAPPQIGPNAALIFEVELLAIK